MNTSCLLDAVNAVITAVGDIPFAWDDIAIQDRSRKDKLMQLVRMWNDQVSREQAGTGYTFQKPACFIEILNMQNAMFLEGVSTADLIWRLHIIDEELDAGDESGMDQNLNVIAYRDAVKQAIGGFQPPNCSTMFPVNEEPDYQHTGVYHYKIDFKSLFTDTKGSDIDPEQTVFIYSTPPTNLELNTAFVEPPAAPEDPLTNYTWKVCAIAAQIVAIPDPSITQTLDNGAVIPLQYALNLDGTLTVPYLLSTAGIAVLTPFIIDNSIVDDEPYDPTTATFDNTDLGGFAVGNIIGFNASLPLGVT